MVAKILKLPIRLAILGAIFHGCTAIRDDKLHDKQSENEHVFRISEVGEFHSEGLHERANTSHHVSQDMEQHVVFAKKHVGAGVKDNSSQSHSNSPFASNRSDSAPKDHEDSKNLTADGVTNESSSQKDNEKTVADPKEEIQASTEALAANKGELSSSTKSLEEDSAANKKPLAETTEIREKQANTLPFSDKARSSAPLSSPFQTQAEQQATPREVPSAKGSTWVQGARSSSSSRYLVDLGVAVFAVALVCIVMQLRRSQLESTTEHQNVEAGVHAAHIASGGPH